MRTIFKQQYLSPRPKTCSVRIGVDGYSAWTFPYWGLQPPEIDLAQCEVHAGKSRSRRRKTCRSGGRPQTKNIAFTSLWDNWPRSVSVPVGKRAEAVWLLVCGSTNPMQTRIANAEVRFRYADGKTEKLELTPPLNFWSLCPFGGADYDYHTDAFCLPEAAAAQRPIGQQLPGDGSLLETAAGRETRIRDPGNAVARRGHRADGREPDEPAKNCTAAVCETASGCRYPITLRYSLKWITKRFSHRIAASPTKSA